MAIGTTLLECEKMLRMEAGRSVSGITGGDETEALRMRLRLSQEKLWDEFNWAGFDADFDIEVEEGQEWFTLPDSIDFSKSKKAFIREAGQKFLTIERGYSTSDYENISDIGVPVAFKYMTRPQVELIENNDPATDVQTFWNPVISLWPVPDRPITFRIEGKRRLRRFTQSDDRCELDDMMIVLDSAASVLGRNNDLRYNVVRAEAKRRLEQMKSEQSSFVPKTFHMGSQPSYKRRGVIRAPGT